MMTSTSAVCCSGIINCKKDTMDASNLKIPVHTGMLLGILIILEFQDLCMPIYI